MRIDKQLVSRALHRKVLAVAVVNQVVDAPPDHNGWKGDWKVYIGPVPGYNHEEEKTIVALEGDKTTEAIAAVLFPDLANWCAENDLRWAL